MVYREELLPLADLVTPNAFEAALLCGLPCTVTHRIPPLPSPCGRVPAPLLVTHVRAPTVPPYATLRDEAGVVTRGSYG